MSEAKRIVNSEREAYDEDLFTEDFGHLRTVYPGYDTMARNICDIASLNTKESYANYHGSSMNYVRNTWTTESMCGT